MAVAGDGPVRSSAGDDSFGHEERFPPSRLSTRCGFSKKAFGGARGNEKDAPIAVNILEP
ncbi:MAG: hypothetical protein WB611_16035 [Stellaceae bacterium]